MKSLFTIAITALSLSTVASAEISHECWDGSFGYNHARIVESSRGIEVSLSGSTLNLPPLYQNWSMPLQFGDLFNGLKPSVHIVLPKASKTEAGSTTWSDNVVIIPPTEDNPWTQAKWPVLWLQHYGKNLGTWQELLTDIEVKNLSVTLDDNAVTVRFTQHFAPGEPEAQEISVGCAHKSAPESVALPSKLKTHIDSLAK